MELLTSPSAPTSTQSRNQYAQAARDMAIHQEGLDKIFGSVQDQYFHTKMPDPYFYTTVPDPNLAQFMPGKLVDTPQWEMHVCSEECMPLYHEGLEESFESLYRRLPNVEGFRRASSLERDTGAVSNEMGHTNSACVSNFTLHDEEREYLQGESNYPQDRDNGGYVPDTVSKYISRSARVTPAKGSFGIITNSETVGILWTRSTAIRSGVAGSAL
ncbi:hypothetical protein HBI56_114620 [Parastagonospora nodorum]|uniref:Uncharacterized protein n=1 Tax=Phaeosphaeria nodorum (strain SN15 / ATCC MYA-4574 / FGSC 10173) TaxID=321614 RepID=A0A7U2F874_PHANO|nr:hypothetical protein HBH56_195470 [Parastagonospora nodorum]QRD00541.1 hypothetical protein JI435_438320 [Parastagonospora nodorum SN15]KAH3924969.1 hypothetical protein HBH54_188020 [Parastagonospora nodorum]KAH3952873.1 hypothetical protein HBH53_040170 [Parastagonospora nodorum]KAH4131488.1 hypothetical protein HBH45_192410 [Parastagonospora nodorum]